MRGLGVIHLHMQRSLFGVGLVVGGSDELIPLAMKDLKTHAKAFLKESYE